MLQKRQSIRDAKRDIYSVTFPTDLTADRVLAWLGSISGTLARRGGGPFDKDSIVFETWATSSGITHRLMTPHGASEYIATQLRTHGGGISISKDDTRPSINWTSGVQVGMSNPLRQLRIQKHADLSASLLGAVQALQEGETVLIQWVVAPAPFETPPVVGKTPSGQFSMTRALFGHVEASNAELKDRATKLAEQNVLATGRIVANAPSKARGDELLKRVESALSQANSSATSFKTKGIGEQIVNDANKATTPAMMNAQFSLTELAGVISWPIGTPNVAGLSTGATRHIYATTEVPSDGRVLGNSNYPGHERPVAVAYKDAIKHMFVSGGSGTGKTTAINNCFVQDVSRGYGAIVIDASNSESSETMFQSALRSIPESRLKDVIIIDAAADREMPVGFNLLDQGHKYVVRDQITQLIANLYADTSGVWTKQLLFYGLGTIMETPGLTLADLVPLLNRKTKEEAAWADELIRKVSDPDVRDFWQRWEGFTASDRDRYSQPLYNRIWQLVSRPEVRDIIGQSVSSFKIDDVLRENKILLVNLAGLPPETSSILGTLLVNAISTSAYSMRPENPNFLYLDEFQVMTEKLPIRIDDMLSRARKHNLGLVLATQYLDQVPMEIRRAVIANCATKLVFNVSSAEARIWRDEFNGQLDLNDFQYVRKYEAIASVAGTTVTLASLAPAKTTGFRNHVVQMSRANYGRTLQAVDADRKARRTASTPTKPRATIGDLPWDE